MRLLTQYYESDCFPTCVAMVAGIPYRRAIDLVHPNHIKGQDYSTDELRAREVLENLGFRVIRRRNRLHSFSAITRPAIVAIKLKCENDGHVLVWDPARQRLLEPYKKYRSLPHSLYLSSIEWVWELSR